MPIVGDLARPALCHAHPRSRNLLGDVSLSFNAVGLAGDTWNTITNIEKRLGVSALVIPAVAGSVYAAVKSYGEVSRLAGLLLSPNAVWLTIASVLTFTIWRINEPAQPLYPEVGDGKSSQLRLRFLGQISATTIPNTPVLPEPKVSKPEGSVLSDRDWAIINAGLQK